VAAVAGGAFQQGGGELMQVHGARRRAHGRSLGIRVTP
jgi:hypothetical protein